MPLQHAFWTFRCLAECAARIASMRIRCVAPASVSVTLASCG